MNRYPLSRKRAVGIAFSAAAQRETASGPILVTSLNVPKVTYPFLSAGAAVTPGA